MNSPAFLKGTTFRIVCAGILLIQLIFFIWTTSFSIAADDQSTKAVRRTSWDQKRIALVIGNNEYKEAPLKNPAHDAQDIASALRALGFTVITKTNADQREIEDAVKEFVRQIQNGDVGLFYFSGHGVQVHGENYLMPVGDHITSEADVKYKAVSAGHILAQMEESRNRTNIFVLDACRNNPFRGFRSMSKGLNMMDAPAGTFIAYATAPGSVAADGRDRNSPYAKHLIEAIKTKDIPIEQVFKHVLREVRKETQGQQVPWTASSLQDDFYFNPSTPRSQSGSQARGTSDEKIRSDKIKQEVPGKQQEQDRNEAARVRESIRSNLRKIAEFRDQEKNKMKAKYGCWAGNIEKGNSGWASRQDLAEASKNAFEKCQENGGPCEELYSVCIHNDTAKKITIRIFHSKDPNYRAKNNSLWNWSYAPGDDNNLAVGGKRLFVPKTFYLSAESQDGEAVWNPIQIEAYKSCKLRNNKDGQNLHLHLVYTKQSGQEGAKK